MASAHRLSGNPAPIAIVGMGCRLPGGADNPAALWALLCEGVDAISEIPTDRWDASRFFDPDPARAGKCPTRSGGFIDGIDLFDAAFFGISPREAARMDPQQRLLLEVAWEALEDGAQPVDRRTPVNTGVFVGISGVDYSPVQEMLDDLAGIDAHTATGTAYSIAANRISHALNFTGPSISVDTACSSSLVALHLACTSLQNGECDRALACGVNIILNPRVYVAFSRLAMLSPDGRCRAFDAKGAGFVRAEGVGVVVLKALGRALEDGDPIYAVVRGTGINQDGRTPGITMPGGDAQAALVRDVCARAGVDPRDVSYVESHGPGTPVGDPIEAESLSEVLCEGRSPEDALFLGSIKTNIGHLEPVAGIAGLMKAALMVAHRMIPANLHFDEPNPAIDFERLRLRIPRALQPWPAHRPVVAGVDAFGFGGTNAHALLTAPPAREPAAAEPGSGRPELVCLSAHSAQALASYAGACRDFARAGRWAGHSLRDVAWTAATRRTHHAHRIGVVATTVDELAERLGAFHAGATAGGIAAGRVWTDDRRRIAFVYPGQGPQWWAMGRELLDQEPVFFREVARCDRLLEAHAGWSLLQELTANETESRMGMPAIAQPAIFCLQVALTALWASWGIRPDATVGHSVGEAAAAYAGGVLSLDEALRIIYHRGRCMQLVPATGRMLAVGLGLADAEELVAPHAGRVSVGAINSPDSVTLSGDADALVAIERVLHAREIYCRPLKVSYAFHSHHMDGIRDELLASLRDVRTQGPAVRVYAAVSGRPAVEGDFGPDYWWGNVRQVVRFSDAIAGLVDDGFDVFLEVGPHPVLSGPVGECAQRAGRPATVVHSLRRGEPERAEMLAGLGALHRLGANVEWEGLFPAAGRVAPFPTYSWDHERYWHQSDDCREFLRGAPGGALLGRRLQAPTPAWEAAVSGQVIPFLRDHAVHGNTTLPGTAYVELALAASAACGIDAPIVEGLHLHRPAFLSPESDLTLQTRYDPDDCSFTVHSRATGTAAWQLHASGTVLPNQGAAPEAVDVNGVTARFPGDGSIDGYYAELRSYGFEYGPAFKGVARLFRGESEHLGEVVLPREVLQDLDRYRFHPAALDACLQTMGRAAPLTPGCTYLPVAFGRVRVFGRPAPRMWSHVHRVRTAGSSTFGSLRVFSDDGTVIAEVDDFEARTVREDRDQGLQDVARLFHACRWVAAPPREPGDGARSDARAAGRWLVFGDGGGLGARLASALERCGGRPVLVARGAAFSARGQAHYLVRPGSAEDMSRLLDAEFPGGDVSACRGIVHLWSLDLPSAGLPTEADLCNHVPATCMSVVTLLQALMAREGDAAPRLWLVTRGAAAGLEADGGGVSVAQAPLWGLGRVVKNEYPLVRCVLVDLAADTAAPGEAEDNALLDEVLTGDDEDEVAFCAGVRHLHRFEPASLDAPWSDVQAVPVNGERGFTLECFPRGVLDNLRLRESHRRAPADREIEIAVSAAGLNFRDIMQVLSLLPGATDESPPLGIECAGVVTRVGRGVTAFRTGDRVLAFAARCMASHVTVSDHAAVLMPEGLSFEAGATMPAAFVTAHFGLLSEARLQAGERVLIHSASGGVGLAAIQVARSVGASVIATAGTPEKRRYLEDMGIEHVLDSRSLAFADRILALTGGEGVDVVLNSLAGEAIPKGLSILRNKGRFVELGVRDMLQNRRLAMSLFRNNLSFYFVDFGRVNAEQPERVTWVLNEVMAGLSRGVYAPLPSRVFPISEAQDAFRLMAQAKHIGKIVLSLDGTDPPVAPRAGAGGRLRPDASYLITGGLGGFGLAVARWMVAQGARHLVLMGRSGAATDTARDAVRAMQDAGATVGVAAADVTSERDVSDVVAEIRRRLPPLRGVVHAAMVIDDCLLPNLSVGRLDAVLGPKMLGAWHLDRLTTDMPLDFFVLFSSCSSILGLPGQANYNAGNAFLDALAWQRRRRDAPATSVNWGFLGSVGYAAGHAHVVARFDAIGVLSIPPESALEALGEIIDRKPTQLSVLNIDWGTFLDKTPTCARSPRFSHFAAQARAGRGSGGATAEIASLRRTISLLDCAAALEAVEAALREQVARVVCTSAESIDAGTTLSDLGFDSLMAVELRNWAERAMGVRVRTMEIMRGPTIRQLAQSLLASCKTATAAGPPGPG
jgi:acyl transferase domain-containing protein/NADPH:quinone reductase-like Zn-dependent oxidoreductase/aryl carrier-like protein